MADINNEECKKQFTNAFNFCWKLLKVNNYYLSEICCDDTSKQSTIYGQKMYNKLLEIFEDMLKNNDVTQLNDINNDPVDIEFITVDEDYDKLNNIDEPAVDIFDDVDDLSKYEKQAEEIEDVPLNKRLIGKLKSATSTDSTCDQMDNKNSSINNSVDDDDDDDDEDYSLVEKSGALVPLSEKIRVINTLKNNPDWTAEMIREHTGCKYIRSRKTLLHWIQQVENKKSLFQANKKINDWVFRKCVEYKNKDIILNNYSIINLRNEAKEVLNIDDKFKLPAASTWLTRFKKEYNIIGDASNLILLDMNVISSSSSTASLSSSPDISIDKSINKVNVIPIRLRAKKICVPLDEKTRVVKLAKQIGPNCSFKTLQEKSGCKYLKTRQQLAEWQEQVDKGGPCDYQFNKISNWVYSKCLEEKKNNRIITNSLICCWGIEAKEKFMFTSLKFQATKAWVTLFKRKYKIYGDPNDLKISN
ncbi:hypothetical protein HCN44_010880 [Aphidius gifuensis]|uniref:HTH CENPB-type domain-containing protein n=1 Tax=Aphidius gifuensis TaxID=684658 RepID=A0A835CKI4_APHGI|nr:hypothetical protein HCN44_010880 [Aphidius gifuensis]